jgi:hypothetical protein
MSEIIQSLTHLPLAGLFLSATRAQACRTSSSGHDHWAGPEAYPVSAAACPSWRAIPFSGLDTRLELTASDQELVAVGAPPVNWPLGYCHD